MRYHFIREKLENLEINVEYISSQDQLANFFTKGLPQDKFKYLQNKIGITNRQEVLSL